MAKYNYYISSGELNKMYTLRVAYNETHANAGGTYIVERDYYCCNLSNDEAKAKEKAKNIVEGHKDSVLLDQPKLFELGKIKQRSPEELAELAELAAERQKRAQEEFEERCYQARLTKIDIITSGRWPFGKYSEKGIGHEFGDDSPDYGYIKYFLTLDTSDAEKNHKAVMNTLQNYLQARFAWLLKLPQPNGALYGEIKSRESMVITLIEEFSFESSYGYNQFTHVQNFVKDSGELIVYMGSAPIDCHLGSTIEVKATIKKHDEYKGENQTFISRPKLLTKQEAA